MVGLGLKELLKACAFIALNDGSCQAIIQLVVDNDSSEFEKLSNVELAHLLV